MFQSLRQNSLVYIFHKSDKPTLEIGYVSNVPMPKPKYTIPALFGLQQELIVDLVVKVNNHTVNYNGIPAHLDIADTFSNGENVVISDNRNAINSEIISFKQRSIDAINSVEQHKGIIAGCENILLELNPEYAEKLQQLVELNGLKLLMSEMSKNMSLLMEANRMLIEQINRKEKQNELNVGNS